MKRRVCGVPHLLDAGTRTWGTWPEISFASQERCYCDDAKWPFQQFLCIWRGLTFFRDFWFHCITADLRLMAILAAQPSILSERRDKTTTVISVTSNDGALAGGSVQPAPKKK
jgi:hypothetical protein